MDTLPLLLPSRDQAAKDLVSMMGQCSSAKEVIIAVQESMEHLGVLFQADDEDDEGLDAKSHPLPSQLLSLIELYTSGRALNDVGGFTLTLLPAVPRLKLRQKSAFETINPLLVELQEMIPLAAARATRDEGRALIVSVSNLATQITRWMKTGLDLKEDETLACKVGFHDCFRNYT